MIVETEDTPVKVRIMGKEYQVVCEDNERLPLVDAARYLDKKMKDIRDARKVIGAEKIAVMAALNIAHEYLQCLENNTTSSQLTPGYLKGITDKIEMALSRCQQMELET